MKENTFILPDKDRNAAPDLDYLKPDIYQTLVNANDVNTLLAYFKDPSDIKAFGFLGDKCTGFDVVFQEYDRQKYAFRTGGEKKLVFKVSNGQRVLEYADFINLVKLNNLRVEGMRSIKNAFTGGIKKG